LFLDEAFSALDYSTRLSVSDDVYKIIKDTGKTTLMVTHDIGEAISMADKVIVLSKGPAVVKKVYDIQLDKKSIKSETLTYKEAKKFIEKQQEQAAKEQTKQQKKKQNNE
jgi:NitT/TauT family transport system ATP-binding protein